VSLKRQLQKYVEIKGQLDATEWFLLQNLFSAQHVSDTITPIIRSSTVIQMVAACGTWCFGVQCGAVGYASGLRDVALATSRNQSAMYHRQQPSV
jgi:hypothetical protein